MRQTYLFKNIYLSNTATIISSNESKSIITPYVDIVMEDIYFNEKSFEKAEIKIQSTLIDLIKQKQLLCEFNIDFLINGDLNNQEIISTYALKNYDIPSFSVFGACSNFTLTLLIASIMMDNNTNINNVLTMVSSHNLTAERTFRSPVEYGGFKEDTQTFTTTGGSICHLTKKKSKVRITSGTMGIVTDINNSNVNDMGSAMAPAAIETLITHFEEMKTHPKDYDLIVTGDLSRIGKSIVRDFLLEKYNYCKNYDDCGSIITESFNNKTFQGGSGCACSGVVVSSYIYHKLVNKELNKVLVIATGALMNPTMLLQKESIPGIAHAIVLEGVN